MDVFWRVLKVKKWIQLYDFAKFKAQTSCFKGVATEELPARNGNDLEIMDIGNLKVIRGVQGNSSLLPRISSWSNWCKWSKTRN